MQISPMFRPVLIHALLFLAVIVAASNAFGAGDTVVATVGSHKITEAELEARIKPEMAGLESKIYDLKHQALESMAEENLTEEAGKKAKLAVPEYLRRKEEQKAAKVTEADARKYYD